jgi:ribosomal protein S18 acetylase RimI-like enzyme
MAVMEIRRITAKDAAAWHRLRKRSIAEHPEAFLTSSTEEERTTLETVAERLAAPAETAAVFGGSVDGALVATIGVFRGMHEKARHRASIWGVYVTPEQRGRGYGRQLMQVAIEHARSIGIERLHLSVTPDNHTARELYEKLGFESWGVERDAFRVDNKPVDQNHMVVTLTA